MGKYCYEYPRPAVTVDVAVFRWEDGLKILLIQRARDPFAGQWALPGGFVDIDEPLEAAARRELREETGLSNLATHEFGVFGQPGRDPRGRTISIAYYALVPASQQVQVQGGDDASHAAWFDVRALPALAFDHDRIVRAARERLRQGVLCEGQAFVLLPETFTVAQLSAVYQAILDRPVDPEGLLQRLHSLDLLETVGARPQPTYRLNRPRLEMLLREERLAPLGDAPRPMAR